MHHLYKKKPFLVSLQIYTSVFANFYNLYLWQFETALTTEQKEIQMKEPITSDDVTFLSSVVSVPYIEGSTKLDLSDLEKKQIHGFGIIFKVLHGKNASLFFLGFHLQLNFKTIIF